MKLKFEVSEAFTYISVMIFHYPMEYWKQGSTVQKQIQVSWDLKHKILEALLKEKQ